jgi:hypothetical protein
MQLIGMGCIRYMQIYRIEILMVPVIDRSMNYNQLIYYNQLYTYAFMHTIYANIYDRQCKRIESGYMHTYKFIIFVYDQLHVFLCMYMTEWKS